MKSGAQKRKESTTAISKFCCKVQRAVGILAASITPTNNNLAEKPVMLYS